MTQVFSLDGMAPPLPLLPEMLLLTDLRSLVSHLFNFDLCPSTLSIGVCVCASVADGVSVCVAVTSWLPRPGMA